MTRFSALGLAGIVLALVSGCREPWGNMLQRMHAPPMAADLSTIAGTYRNQSPGQPLGSRSKLWWLLSRNQCSEELSQEDDTVELSFHDRKLRIRLLRAGQVVREESIRYRLGRRSISLNTKHKLEAEKFFVVYFYEATTLAMDDKDRLCVIWNGSGTLIFPLLFTGDGWGVEEFERSKGDGPSMRLR